MVKNNFMFFSNFKAIADKLDDTMRLKFYDALTDYVFNGVEPDDVIISALLEAIKPSLNKSDTRGGARPGAGAPKNNQNAKSKTIKNNQNNQNNQTFLETETETETERESDREKKITHKPLPGVFTPPTLEDVLVYAKQMNDTRGVGGFACSKNTATDFFTHYDRQGWLLGNGIHMAKWQPALRRWAAEEERKVMEQ